MSDVLVWLGIGLGGVGALALAFVVMTALWPPDEDD